jgi:hypothetical protein
MFELADSRHVHMPGFLALGWIPAVNYITLHTLVYDGYNLQHW